MALFREKDGTLNFEALCFLGLGVYFLVKTIPSGDALFLTLSIALIGVGIGKGMKKRWGGWLELAFMLSCFLMLPILWHRFSHLAWFAMVAGLCWSVWSTWQEIKAWSDDDDADDEENDNKPIISLVLLLSKPRYLEDTVLAHIVESAWGGNYTEGDEEKRDGFVVSSGPINLVKSPMGMFVVHNVPAPYWSEPDEVAASHPDLRIRKIILEHQAWLSVDLMGSDDDDPQHAASYAVIVRLLNELADDTVLGIYRPETHRISEWNEEVQTELLRPRGEEKFFEAGNGPVIPVAADDPEMIAAIAEARARWPEFIAAYGKRSKDDPFSIKAPVTVDERTEHIWITVVGLEPNYVHGTLANEPVDLGELKLGSRVEVPVADVEDWAYKVGEEFEGLFTPKVVFKRQQEFNPPQS